MRTTLTLEPDIADRLKELARLEGKSFKQVVNELLSQSLTLRQNERRHGKKFKVRSFQSAFRSGVDPMKLNQLSDELEVDDFLAETSGKS